MRESSVNPFSRESNRLVKSFERIENLASLDLSVNACHTGPIQTKMQFASFCPAQRVQITSCVIILCLVKNLFLVLFAAKPCELNSAHAFFALQYYSFQVLSFHDRLQDRVGSLCLVVRGYLDATFRAYNLSTSFYIG